MKLNMPASDPMLHDICPSFCGFEDCEPDHSFGPAVRSYYLIHYVLKGHGTFSCGKTYELSKGQCFLIVPGDVTFYKAAGDEPWSYLWIAFDGEFAKTILKRAGVDRENPIFGNEAVAELFTELYDRLTGGSFPKDRAALVLASFLFSVFSCLPQNDARSLTQVEKYVAQAKDYIESMYSYRITVEQLAQYCGLDRRYLCRIFKAHTGQTLMGYILNQRISRAKELLVSSALSVDAISRSVGYGDVFNFSKMFKKQVGRSPLKYRKFPDG